MATINAQITENEDGSISVLWETLTNTNNVGSAYQPPAGYGLDQVLFSGTFGAAAVLQTSPDGTNFNTGEDVASAAMSASAAGVFNAGGQKARAFRPSVGAVTDVDCTAYFSPCR